MLALIWSVSLVLSACSILVMVTLVLRRFMAERHHGDDDRQRRALQLALIRFTQDGDRARLDAELARVSQLVIVEAGFELLSLLRGEERTTIERIFAEIGLPDFTRRQLARGNEAERIHACEVLEAFPAPRTTAGLRAALSDRSREVRMAAAIVLARLDAIPPLDAVLTKLGTRGLRSRRLIELFQTFPAHRSAELRAYALSSTGAPPVRAAAIDALSLGGDYTLLPVFARCAQNRSVEIAAAAIRALGRSAHPAAAGPVSAALASPHWEIRAEAAEAAGRIGAGASVDELCRLLEDVEWSVRFEAGKALRNLGAAGLTALTALASGPSSRGQRTASLVLAESQV